MCDKGVGGGITPRRIGVLVVLVMLVKMLLKSSAIFLFVNGDVVLILRGNRTDISVSKKIYICDNTARNQSHVS